MAGVSSMAISSIAAVIDSHPCPGLCVDAVPLSSLNFRSPVEKSSRPMELSSSFICKWQRRQQPSGLLCSKKKQGRGRKKNVIVDEVAGQYEESFEDIHRQLINYFTYKATRTVLHQLYEMNPPKYSWFYNFLTTNNPIDSKRFLRTLGKEKHDLAERVMITRLHLYGKWIKKCDHAKMYQDISDQNLELMRERLLETVIWPSDDTNTEMIS